MWPSTVRTVGPLVLAFASASSGACASARHEVPTHDPHETAVPLAAGGTAAPPKSGGLLFGAPDEQGIDARPLMKLAERIRDGNLPIFSFLISRNGVLVYELYTASLTRDDAHYLMSVTKSFTSALMGAAIDQHLVGPPETSVADALPSSLFASEADRARFRNVTIKDVLGMSALDAQVPPHRNLPEDRNRQKEFLASPNRTTFALTQALLPQPGVSYQYTDITPLLATGILEYATRTTALEFAERTLFLPMDFHNYEWMHEDKSGIDNGAYGLRLRPVDMQKFGILFLNGGEWEGKQLLSKDWVDRSFSPWIKSSARLSAPDYGWYWWTSSYGPHWLAHAAHGWKGQRIAVIPEKNLVVTMTGIIEDHDVETFFAQIIRDYVIASVDGTANEPARPDPALRRPLADLLEEVRKRTPMRPGMERRLIPAIEPKERHHPFSPT
jgi:CubicO group peptidase (beta-lactamase class C family)